MMPRARVGVQTLVAVILLTLVVATAAIAIYTWLSGVTSTSPTEAQTLKERIRIEAIKYDGSTLSVTVRNIGDIRVILDAVYVLYATNESLVKSQTGINQQIKPGEAKEVSIPVSGLASGEVYLVKVVTVKGIAARATFIAP